MASREEKNKKIINEVEDEQKREKRKKIAKRTIQIFIMIFLFSFCFYFYTKNFSTIGIIVKEERIKNSKIPESFNGIKIIQISDLYYGSTIHKKELKNLVKIVNERKPDIVVFTGNLINKEKKLNTQSQEQLIKELQKIDTTIGKYAINGKDDDDEFTTIMNQSNFNILNNDYDLIYNHDNNPILIVGLSSLLKKERDIDNAYRYFKEETHNANIYTIAIMSETNHLDDIISTYNNDLVLAGNSLNGQIKLPGIGGLIRKEGSDKYKNPYYKVNQTKIYVSSGIGSPDLEIRLFNRPSINFFRIENKK